MEEAERPELGRIAAVARGAIDGDAIKSRLDTATPPVRKPVDRPIE